MWLVIASPLSTHMGIRHDYTALTASQSTGSVQVSYTCFTAPRLCIRTSSSTLNNNSYQWALSLHRPPLHYLGTSTPLEHRVVRAGAYSLAAHFEPRVDNHT